MILNQVNLLLISSLIIFTSSSDAGPLQSKFFAIDQFSRHSVPNYQCTPPELTNGFVRLTRRKARFSCSRNFTLIGETSLHCYGSEWSGEPPVCAAAGCVKFRPPRQGTIKLSIRNLFVVVTCNPGYSLQGSPNIYCDGHYWNASYTSILDMCKKSSSNPSTWCSFENHDQCGWTSDDPDRVTIAGPHTFGYRPYGLTLSDHTGTGHMLVVWSAISELAHSDSVNRLYSPVYDTRESGSCFTFWYHLGGYDKLTDPPPFKVYIKPESETLSDLTPWIFKTSSDAYGQWTLGQVYIPKVIYDWQIVLEFNVWQKVYGLDDLSLDLNVTKCATKSSTLTGISNNWASCKNRCSSPGANNETCSCTSFCIYLDNCCPDYEIFCTNNSTKDEEDVTSSDKLPDKKQLSNETISFEHDIFGLDSKSTSTILPLIWFFTQYPQPTTTKAQSEIYFPTENSLSTNTKVTVLDFRRKTSPPTTPIFTSTISPSTTLPSTKLISISTKKITGNISNFTTESLLINSTLQSTPQENSTFHQTISGNNQTVIPDTIGNVTIPMLNATLEVANNTKVGINETNDVFIESRSLSNEKAELSIETRSSMKTISALIGIFMIASLVGVIILWRRHKTYLGSSVSADSELRFLAHEDD